MFLRIKGLARAVRKFNRSCETARIYYDKGKNKVWTKAYEDPWIYQSDTNEICNKASGYILSDGDIGFNMKEYNNKISKEKLLYYIVSDRIIAHDW